MTTITNPAILSYKLGEMRFGIFSKIPFLLAYWKEDIDIKLDFINLIQLLCNRMDFASTKMRITDRKDKFIYLNMYNDFNDTKYYYASADVSLITPRNFIGYIAVRARDLGALSKHSKLLIGDMNKFDLSSIYRVPINDYKKAKELSSITETREFKNAYQAFKANNITALVNYDSMLE